MKKKLLIIISIVTAALLISAIPLSIILSSAAGNGDRQDTDETLGTGNIDGSDLLATAPDESVSFPEESEADSSSGSETESLTEALTETETVTVTVTVTETETQTEAETETEPSLKYFSYGNGTCAVAGIGDIKDAYVLIPEKSPSGDIVTSIDSKAFYDNTSIIAVHVPSTVMSIGEKAFGGCSALVYISVDDANKSFTAVNGILYSKDKTKLILFPSANTSSELTISINVTEICDMAFFSTPNLKQIKYGGTVKDWANIKVGDQNYGLYSASMTFTATE